MTSHMQEQFTLPFNLPRKYGQYSICDANRVAHKAVTCWPIWADNIIMISGPRHSGKTHLARIWQDISDAYFLQVEELEDAPKRGCYILDGVRFAPENEEKFLHFINLVRETGSYLLITTRKKPDEIYLPDLSSRITALPCYYIMEGEGELMQIILARSFAERQVAIGPDVMSYIMSRMTRTYGNIDDIVGTLDALSMKEGRPITIHTIRKWREAGRLIY